MSSSAILPEFFPGNEISGRTPDKNDSVSSKTDQVEEIISDGSASAFEGTEFIDQEDRDRVLDNKSKTSNDPSGRSDY